MATAIIQTRVNDGLRAVPVTVETHISRGLPKFSIVGLPELSVKESKDRVRCAILNSQYEFPKSRIVVNLAPADLPKEGCRFDLPIALSILTASSQLEMNEWLDYEFIGELALSGELRYTPCLIPAALACAKANRTLVIPEANVPDVAFISECQISPASHLLDICQHFSGQQGLPYFVTQDKPPKLQNERNFADIKGQAYAKRAFEIAAAGQHNILMIGAPGSGKTLLANSFPSIMTRLEREQAMEVAAIQSISGIAVTEQNWCQRPFRAPHHTASYVAMVGGGSPPSPGEVSLAHHGCLFLDELPEFKRQALETLREPLEAGVIKIARAAHFVEYPARFQLIAAMNPCPCGESSLTQEDCRCSVSQINRYRAKISTPLLDRIDIIIELGPVPADQLLASSPSESSASIRERVIAAQKACAPDVHNLSQALPSSLQAESQNLIRHFRLSARAYRRVCTVAHTIARLEQRQVNKHHLHEAIQLRQAARYFQPIRVH